jgi:short-chain 2-methylacyl-CoA dehydrogenase
LALERFEGQIKASLSKSKEDNQLGFKRKRLLLFCVTKREKEWVLFSPFFSIRMFFLRFHDQYPSRDMFQRLLLGKISRCSNLDPTNRRSILKMSTLFHTPEEQMMRDVVAKFAETNIKPHVATMDRESKVPNSLLDQLFRQGLMGIEIEMDYGGSQSSFTSTIVTVEELARIDPAISVICDVQNTLINNLLRQYGNEAQKHHYLPKLASNTIGCFCLSESGSGSDAFALKTRADRKGNHGFLLNGSKMWITNAHEADLFLVFANTDFSQGYRGITCFIVERQMGVQVGKKEDKLGIRASSTCTVHFDQVEVAEDQILGERGKGYRYAMDILNEGRIGIAAQMLGLARGVYDETMPYLFRRRQFDKYIGDFQAMQHQYAELAMEIEAARLLVYQAARLKEQRQSFIKEAAMAKLYASRVAEKASSRCIEWMGGLGFIREVPVEKYFRDCKIGAIYEGTSNIQLDTIAKSIRSVYQSTID